MSLNVDILCQELKGVKWFKLGLKLKLSADDLKVIEHDHQDTDRRRIEMFIEWLRQEVNPSWLKIITALKEMSEKHL